MWTLRWSGLGARIGRRHPDYGAIVQLSAKKDFIGSGCACVVERFPAGDAEILAFPDQNQPFPSLFRKGIPSLAYTVSIKYADSRLGMAPEQVKQPFSAAVESWVHFILGVETLRR